jgi:TorA maturation chaperone TorD
MAGLASRTLPAPADAEHIIFEKHMMPWIGRFFADLEQAEFADFYRRVGSVGRIFVDIEAQAFDMPA